MPLMNVPLQQALREANIEDHGERARAIRAIEVYVDAAARNRNRIVITSELSDEPLVARK